MTHQVHVKPPADWVPHPSVQGLTALYVTVNA